MNSLRKFGNKRGRLIGNSSKITSIPGFTFEELTPSRRGRSIRRGLESIIDVLEFEKVTIYFGFGSDLTRITIRF
jgi:hypothetical protein